MYSLPNYTQVGATWNAYDGGSPFNPTSPMASGPGAAPTAFGFAFDMYGLQLSADRITSLISEVREYASARAGSKQQKKFQYVTGAKSGNVSCSGPFSVGAVKAALDRAPQADRVRALNVLSASDGVWGGWAMPANNAELAGALVAEAHGGQDCTPNDTPSSSVATVVRALLEGMPVTGPATGQGTTANGAPDSNDGGGALGTLWDNIKDVGQNLLDSFLAGGVPGAIASSEGAAQGSEVGKLANVGAVVGMVALGVGIYFIARKA